jgi:ribosomal protein S18 acetylase RimI-like enzyme
MSQQILHPSIAATGHDSKPTAAPAAQVAMLDAAHDSQAAVVLGRAFVDVPLLKGVLRRVFDLPERARILSAVFATALVRQRLRGQPVFGIIYEGEVVAVALIEGTGFPSRRTRLLAATQMLFRMISSAGLGGTLRAIQLSRQITKHHPTEPHLYLSAIGVDPHYQGQHYGTTLLDYLSSLLQLHPDWVGIYLETGTQANLGYYAKAGFRLLGEMHALGVTMWRMMLPRTRS